MMILAADSVHSMRMHLALLGAAPPHQESSCPSVNASKPTKPHHYPCTSLCLYITIQIADNPAITLLCTLIIRKTKKNTRKTPQYFHAKLPMLPSCKLVYAVLPLNRYNLHIPPLRIAEVFRHTRTPQCNPSKNKKRPYFMGRRKALPAGCRRLLPPQGRGGSVSRRDRDQAARNPPPPLRRNQASRSGGEPNARPLFGRGGRRGEALLREAGLSPRICEP